MLTNVSPHSVSTYFSIELDYRNRKGRLPDMWTPNGGTCLFPKKPITLLCFQRPGPGHPLEDAMNGDMSPA